MYSPLPNCAFLHSCYVAPSDQTRNNDLVSCCVKDMTTGESRLHLYRNPNTTIYVLRKGLQNFQFKREYVRISDCDMYVVPYKDQYVEAARKLGRRNPEPWTAKRLVDESPFVFGWDISPQVRIKCEYLDAMPKDPTNINLAVLDIETCVLPENQDGTLALSICDWRTRTVHCFIDNGVWLRAKDTSELEERTKQAYAEFVDGLNEKAKKFWDQQPIVPVYHLCQDETELLIKAFANIQELKPDFMAVWNLGYDVPQLIRRMEFRGLNPAELFCHPDIPPEFRLAVWHEDKSRVDHFTDLWHVLDAPGYTYWYDAMCLYSRLRKVQGRDVSYSLDYIGNKIIGSGKMHFGANQSHYLMQTNDKVGYCVYNTIDTLIPALMDAVTNDLSSMLALSDCSLIQDFSRQTVSLKAQFYRYLQDQGKIPGACHGSMEQEWDKYIGNIGGAVLNPLLMRDRGLVALDDSPRQTNIYVLTADLDVSSFYPSMTVAANVSRETKLATVLWMEGCPHSFAELDSINEPDKRALAAKENAEYINAFFGLLPCSEENAVSLGHDYFNLPDYREMEEIVTKLLGEPHV